VIDSAEFRRAAGVEGLPQSIGRYTVVGLIGQGAWVWSTGRRRSRRGGRSR
jgi:hypothetical protein